MTSPHGNGPDGNPLENFDSIPRSDVNNASGASVAHMDNRRPSYVDAANKPAASATNKPGSAPLSFMEAISAERKVIHAK